MSLSMEISMWMMMLAPILVAVSILVIIIVVDIQYNKETRYTTELLKKCIQLKGFDYTQKLLDIAKNSHLDGKNIIKLLEDACGIKHEERRKKNLWDGLRTMRNTIMPKVK